MINYFLPKKTGTKKVYFRYRPNRETDIRLATPFSIDAKRWDDIHQCYALSFVIKKVKSPQDAENNLILNAFNQKLTDFKIRLDAFTNGKIVSREDIKGFLKKNYGTKAKQTIDSKIPTSFIEFIEYYITQKTDEKKIMYRPLSSASVKKYRVIKNKIKKIVPRITVVGINENFREKYIEWNMKNNYSTTTIVKELKIIKAFVQFALEKKMKVDTSTIFWKFHVPELDYKHPTLSLEELDFIQSVELPLEHLKNARDWLIIGCNLGLRVSDLLKLNKSNVIANKYVVYKQEKTKKNSAAVLYPSVTKIMEKYGFDFPRRISDQKFNLYIKKVCKLAEISLPIHGAKMINKRKVKGIYPKYELVTSHICRRSFITNFLPILGREAVILNSGHSDPKMIELYDQREMIVKAKQIFDKFEKLNGEI